MVESIIKNPFVGCTARDMSFDEVRQYWCNPFSLYNLNEYELFSSRTPIVIEGIRGSGKTMILKYLSYTIQKEFIKDKSVNGKLAYLRNNSFGTYFRYKKDFCSSIYRLDCDQKLKDIIFMQYFELFVSREMIESIDDIYEGKAPQEMLKAVSSALSFHADSLSDVVKRITDYTTLMDKIIGESIFDNSWQEKILPLLANGDYLINLVSHITEEVDEWKDILFSVILDEYENLDVFSCLVNTLIKQVDEKCKLTYRIGMRPAGMEKDNSTRVGVERLQVDRDYILRKLVFIDSNEYRKFAIEVSHKRLNNIDVYAKNGLTDISALLGKNEDIDFEAEVVAKGTKQFELISKVFSDDNERKKAIELISNNEKLLEMYNILLVSRGEKYQEVAETCEKYMVLRKERRLKEAEGLVRKYQLGYGDK